MLRAFIDPLHENWDNMLPFAVHAYNTSVQASTRVSPFRALFGRDPCLPSAPQISSSEDAPTHKDAADWWLYLQSLRPTMRYAITKNLQVAQQRQRRHYDKGREEVTYQLDDLVWVYYPIRRKGLSESLMHRWLGPYRVLRRIRANTYQLYRIGHDTTTSAHVVRMKQYISPTEGGSVASVDLPAEELNRQPSVSTC